MNKIDAGFLRHFQPYLALDRAIWMIAFARFIIAGGTFVLPVYALILTQKLSLSPADAGMMVFIVSIGGMLGSVLGGYLADTFNRLALMAISEAFSAVCVIIAGLFAYDALSIIFIALSSLALGIMRPAMRAAILSLCSTTSESKRYALSLSYLAFNVGHAVGPLIAGFLLLDFYQWLYWGDAATTLIAAYLLASLIKKNTGRKPKADKKTSQESIERSTEHDTQYDARVPDKTQIALFLAVNICVSFCYAQITFTLPLQMAESFADDGARYYGLILMINALAVLGFTTVLTSLTAKTHPIKNLMLAICGYGAGYVMIGFMPILLVMGFAILIITASEILEVTNGDAYLSELVPESRLGRYVSFSVIANNAGIALCPLLMGFAIESIGLSWAWSLVGIVTVFALLCLSFMLKRAEKIPLQP
ncbi:MFS transporter [Enterovibrio norvegicus]|uniref:MFS transporter n=1 Tax=Enterovibrio norvegicus TaxID=188144 RepID=UPI0024B1E1B4|nr:MFS transporter [Enterovibrio norvegicus]